MVTKGRGAGHLLRDRDQRCVYAPAEIKKQKYLLPLQ